MQTVYPRGLVIEEHDGMLIAYWRKLNNNAMKLGKKKEQEEMLLVECEGGKEVNGNRTEAELRQEGYKDVCETEAPNSDSQCTYDEYDTCYVQVWEEKNEIFRNYERN